ncbi:MAG: hypothetical protein K2F64_04215, partial [Muribaculaceae bacterium]|nr:hypothetical protein [Muribaculaceae bacterium]
YYTNPARGNIANCSFGLAIDPDNDKYIYRGSNYNGLVRYNLEDPEDILHLSRDNDPDAGKPGYIKVVDHADIWDILCRFNNPQFDSNGDLYLSHNNLEGEGQRYELWRWSAENRKASVTAERFRPFDRYILPGIEGSNSDLMLVCRHRSNANKIIILASHNETERRLIILDHKGTFTTPSDDKFVIMSGGTDQDGGTFNITGINGFYEDPESGLIWISSDSGVYTMNLSRQNSSTATLNRVKVARNDGTNLADYLLNEVKVNSIIDDGQGRKWYSTSGGLVCTSSDGRRILGEFTAENSPLPSDNVLSAGYNPANGSILISTDRGIAEFHPSGGTVGTDGSSNVRAYPNPVEPDYYGYVTIDGIPDNSLVKIADSGGGLVRELGRAESGSIQ